MALDPDTITATVAALVTGLGIGGKAIHMWTKKNNECTDPACHNNVVETAVEVRELKLDVKELFTLAKDNSGNIQYIKGKIDQVLK